MEPDPRRLRADLPFRRLAVVLSGGGGLGAYEVGTLRVLERLGLKPSIVLGVSVGAINALVWVANGFRSDTLFQTWEGLKPSSVGIRWYALGARAAGAFLIALAILEAVLTFADLPEVRLLAGLGRSAHVLPPRWSDVAVDALAWSLVALAGVLLQLFSGLIESLLARLTPAADPDRLHRLLTRVVIGLALLYPVSLAFPFPWPHRFHLVVVVIAALVWLVSRLLGRSESVRRVVMRMLPETGGRGLWRSTARRRLIEGLLPEGAEERLFQGVTRVIIPACEIASGRMCYFVNAGPGLEPFAAGLYDAIDESFEFRTRGAAVEAALASSAVPLVFEPVRIGGREYMDGGLFSDQPVHAVLADGADAVLLVLVSPGSTPPRVSEDPHLVELAARIPQLVSWRNLRIELRSLPEGWSRGEHPARLCVVEPEGTLPGGVLNFDVGTSESLMSRGEADAWRALERAGWLEAAGGR
jgi:predicted acylesterase/phospholipase RssA